MPVVTGFAATGMAPESPWTSTRPYVNRRALAGASEQECDQGHGYQGEREVT